VAPKKANFFKLATVSAPPSCTKLPTDTKFSASLPRWGL